MRCVIFAAMPVSEAMHADYEGADCIIAADAGWRTVQALGLHADFLVGDYDSAPPPCEPEQPGMPQPCVLPMEKDDTDTFYAARKAVELGATHLIILGGTGGRFEHTLANMHTLVFLEQNGVEAWLADETMHLRALLPGRYAFARRDAWVSLFPIGESAGGVTLTGLYYPLQNATLRCNYPVGISNEFAEETAQICVETGGVYLVLTEKSMDREEA